MTSKRDIEKKLIGKEKMSFGSFSTTKLSDAFCGESGPQRYVSENPFFPMELGERMAQLFLTQPNDPVDGVFVQWVREIVKKRLADDSLDEKSAAKFIDTMALQVVVFIKAQIKGAMFSEAESKSVKALFEDAELLKSRLLVLQRELTAIESDLSAQSRRSKSKDFHPQRLEEFKHEKKKSETDIAGIEAKKEALRRKYEDVYVKLRAVVGRCEAYCKQGENFLLVLDRAPRQVSGLLHYAKKLKLGDEKTVPSQVSAFYDAMANGFIFEATKKMSPDIVVGKFAAMRNLVNDCLNFLDAGAREEKQDPYVEKLFAFMAKRLMSVCSHLVMLSSDAVLPNVKKVPIVMPNAIQEMLIECLAYIRSHRPVSADQKFQSNSILESQLRALAIKYPAIKSYTTSALVTEEFLSVGKMKESDKSVGPVNRP